MNTDSITPMIITYNEGANLTRSLAKLNWAREILIIDSGSTDETLSIASRHTHVRVVEREFDTFASQCNFGLSQVCSEWTLSLDADYVLTDELISEIRALRTELDGYNAPFIYCVYGRRLRSSLYPCRTVLYKTNLARYHDEGHGHKVMVVGEVGSLKSAILHDDRKGLERWFRAQLNYASAEADHILNPDHRLNMVDQLRRMVIPAPLIVFLYVLFGKRCVFDGWPGVFYALQRFIAEAILALEIADRRFNENEVPHEVKLWK